MKAAWSVEVPLVLGGPATAIERYAEGLQAHLEHSCPALQPSVVMREGQAVAVFSRVHGAESTARMRAMYWCRRGIEKEKSIRFKPSMIDLENVRTRRADPGRVRRPK